MPKGLSGSTSVSGFSVDYHEIKQNPGGGPRGLGVALKGHAGSKFKFYPINPNPHDNPSYNSNQAKFYADAAKHVVQGFSFAADDVTCPYPNLPQAPYNPKEMAKLMTNNLGKKLTSKTEWGKMSSQEQQNFIKEYPKKVAEYKKEQAVIQATAEWKAHLAKKSNSSVSWEGVQYHLPKVEADSE